MVIEQRKIIKICLLLTLFALLLSTRVNAVELPEHLLETLPEDLKDAIDNQSISEGFAWLASSAWETFFALLRDGMRDAALLTLVAMLCGAAAGMDHGGEGAAAHYVSLCGVLAAAELASGDLRAMIGLGAQTVQELGNLAKLLLPTISTSMAAGGYVSTAGLWQVTTLMVCDLLGDLIGRVLLPLVYCYIAAAVAEAALGEGRLTMLADGIHKLVTGALTVSVTCFTAYLSVAGVLTGSADRAAVKVTKLAVSGAIPVVGGVLSDVTESVLAAAGTLRGAIGAVGVLAIGALCLTPLLRLGVHFVLYRLAAFTSGLVGTKTLTAFLERLGGAFALVFAMTASCALLLLVALLVAASMTTV